MIVLCLNGQSIASNLLHALKMLEVSRVSRVRAPTVNTDQLRPHRNWKG